MKKVVFLVVFGVLVISGLTAQTHYWVGGTGSWTDSKHWSLTSGGVGGAAIPTINDNVIFDQNSFNAYHQVVQILSDAACRNIDFSGINHKIILAGGVNSNLNIAGSFTFSPLIINGFKGAFFFISGSTNTLITTAGSAIQGKLIFDGSGSWIFNDDVNGELSSEIILKKGKLNTNGKSINVARFSTNGNNNKSLDLQSSEVYIKELWDFSNNDNLTFNAGSSRIAFDGDITATNFKSGNLSYSSVSSMLGPCVGGSTPANCNFFTITFNSTNVTCNGFADGTVNAVITGGSGSYTYSWNNGQTTPNISGLGPGTYLLTVTDIGVLPNRTCFCSIQITEPATLFPYELYIDEPTCNGLCDGSAGVDLVGGTFPYTYSWSPSGGTNDTATSLCANTYTVTVTDGNGCVATTNVFLTEPVAVDASGSVTDVTCFGACDGTATVAPTGGTGSYTYAWAPNGSIAASISGLCPSTHTCTVTDGNGCSDTYIATITQPPALNLSVSQVNVTCGGACDGTADATVVGGSPNYTYSWSNGASTTTSSTTNGVISLCAASYTITLTDGNGCSTNRTFTITEPPVLTVTPSAVDVACFGDCDGTATALIGGGTPAYTIDWLPGTPSGDGTANLTNLCAGTYTVNVIDANLCAATGTITVSEPAVLAANPTSTNITCFGACDGTATATPTGGTSPYTYDWAPGTPTGDGTSSISALCPGNYTVTVTDANLCTSVQSVNITQPPVLNMNVSRTNVTCNGACDGTAISAPSGGTSPYTFSWAPGGQTTASISGLCPGTYTVTVTDGGGCSRTATVTITQPNSLSVSLSSTAITCNGDCNSTVGATVLGGAPTFNFLWAPGGQTTSSITNQCAGTYTVTVTDNNGCTATNNITVSQPTQLNIVSSPIDATCFGVCDGSIGVIVGGGTPGYTYLWAPGGQTSSSISNQCVGSYSITVTDLAGCLIYDTIDISQPNTLLANPSVVNNLRCSGSCDGSLAVVPTGGTMPYTYDWLPGTPTGDGTDTVTNLCLGTYTVTVVDANLCQSTLTASVTQPTILSASISSSTSSCNICNGTATVVGAGGTGSYSYSWNPTGQTTATATGLCPNVTYTVTITDGNGCTAQATVTILPTVVINITTSNTVLSCFGACDGTVTANASGGTAPYSFLWQPGNLNTQTISNLCSGTYTVNVSDNAGCFNTATVTFTDPPVLDVTSSKTDITCNGACDGTATANPTGGTGTYTYSWMPGGQTTQIAAGLCAGDYTVTVTDSSGCTDVSQITVSEPTAIVDNFTMTNPTCTLADGDISVAPTGGAGGYIYNWGPGSPTGDGTSAISALVSGVYTLDITDGTGCTFSFSYLLSSAAGPVLNTTGTNVICNGQCNGTANVAVLSGVGGYVYDWLPGSPTGDGTTSITNLCGTTTYTIQVTDALGCVTLDTNTVIDPALLTGTAVVVNESCFGSCDGSISLSPVGGTGAYSYTWSGGLPSTSSQSGLCASGSPYIVTITDGNGCDSTVFIPITSPPLLAVTLDSTNVLCKGACDGTATAVASGGSGSYSYSWSHGAAFVLPNVVNLCPGQYIVTVTDSNSCTVADTVNIEEPAVALITSISSINISCNGLCDGSGTVTASGGTGSYSYLWNPTGDITSTVSNFCAGTYNVTVTDANGCTSTPANIVITEPTLIVPTASYTDPLCNNSCDGTSVANPVGGSGTYTYLWSPGAFISQSVSSLCARTYTVTVTDSAGCSNIETVTLTDPLTLSANTSGTQPTCSNSCDATAMANPVGGTGSYIYSWSPVSSTNQSITNLCPGSYEVIVTDGNNCTDTQTVVINNVLPIDAIISGTPSTCSSCDGTVSVTALNGTPSYAYVWNPAPGVGQGTPNATQVCAGLYDLLITDSLGCDSTFVIAVNNASGPTGEIVTANNVTCFGVCNGSASLIPVGGTSPYNYLWNDAASTANDTALNLCSGSYFVQVTDSLGCVHFSPVTITEPSEILPNGTITSAVCSGVCTGGIVIVPTGGVGSYSYNWAPGNPTGQGTDSVSSLCPGTYTLTTTDANLCAKIDSFVIGQTSPLSATIASTNIFCSSACSGLAYINITSGTPPYVIQWNDPLGQTNDTATALCAGSYAVTISDSLGCSITLTTTVTATPPVSANAAIANPNCGLCDGQVTLTPSGGTPGYTYLWSTGQTTSSITNLCSGLYSVDITDSTGCTTNLSIPVSNSNGPTSSVKTSTNVTCYGLCDGSVTSVSPVGGTAPYSFLWIQGGQTTSALSNICSGVYYVQITDSAGCSLIDSVTITEPSQIMANQQITAATCNLCDGAITIAPSGGISPYSVLWNTSSTSLTLSNLCAGVYSVQITDSNSCVQNIVVPISNQNSPLLSVSSVDATCFGSCDGSALVVASGGTPPYTYLWNDSNATANDSVSSLCTGNYFVQVTGADGCIAIANASIVEPNVISFSAATSITSSCTSVANGSITIIPSGGTFPYAYLWSPLPGGGQGTNVATGLLGGVSYVVTVTDTNGCTGTQTIVLPNPPSITISPNAVITDASCGLCDGQAALAPSGGTSPYTYLWSNNQTSATASNLCSGLYSVNITDSAGCVANVAIPISNSGGPTGAVINSTNVSCYGLCDGTVTGVTPSGGVPPYTYLWIQGGQTTTTLNNLCAGVYYVQITDSMGCSYMDSVIIASPSQIMANQQITAATCNICDGSITIAPGNGTGPYSILWNTGSTALALSNLCAGVYSVQITDANGCVENAIMPLNNQNAPVLSISSTDISCFDTCNGTATVVATGGVLPYTYLWNDVNLQTTLTATALCAGNYFVQVTGADGCVSVASTSITEPAIISFNLPSVMEPLCNGDTNGSITAIPFGGTLPYTYSWAPSGGAGFTETNLGVNTYTLMVTDANGCVANQVTTLTEPPVLTISDTAISSSCNAIPDGSIDVTVGGGTVPYSYQWSGASNAITEDLTNISAGSYTLTVTDTNGCIIADTINLAPSLIVTANIGNDTTFCESGSFVLDASTSVNGVNYQWFQIPSNTSIGNSTSLTINPPTGTTSYYALVDDGSGCSDMDTIIITSNPLPVADAGPDVTILFGHSVTIGGNPTGTSGCTFSWSPIPGLDDGTLANPVANPGSTTVYTVIVTSVEGCSSIDSMEVTVVPEVGVSGGITPNGDGKNDEWNIEFIELFPNCTVEVYNRWGELLFQSKGYTEKWKGTYKGKPLPVGTYYYIINLNDPLFPNAYTGPLTIMR